MKYKRLLIFVTCMFFVTVSILCFTALYKIADVTVVAVTVENSVEDVKGKTENYLTKYKGKNLVFTNVDEITSDLTKLSSYLKVISVEKTPPNILTVKVQERKECFSVNVNGEFYVLDEEFFCVAKKSENVNNIDGNRNILLDLNITDYPSGSLLVGKQFSVSDAETQNYLQTLVSELPDKRSDILKLNVTVKENGFFNRKLSVITTEGAEFIIDKANVKTIEKFKFAYRYYLSLENKSYEQYIVTVSAETGECIIAK